MDIIKEKEYTFSNLFDVVNRLDCYIEEYLKYEEDLMDMYAFPYKEQHINEHNFARNKVSKINIFDEENFEEQFFKDTLLWFFAWLTKHIMITDKMLESYF